MQPLFPLTSAIIAWHYPFQRLTVLPFCTREKSNTPRWISLTHITSSAPYLPVYCWSGSLRHWVGAMLSQRSVSNNQLHPCSFFLPVLTLWVYPEWKGLITVSQSPATQLTYYSPARTLSPCLLTWYSNGCHTTHPLQLALPHFRSLMQ